MTKGVRFGEGCNIIPVLAPVDMAATATPTIDVDCADANWVTFIIQLGNMTSDATDTVTFTVYGSTAVASTDVAIGDWWYRYSGGAVAVNSWGAITTGSSDGVAISKATEDSYTVIIDVDPVAVAGAEDTARWVHVLITPVGPITLGSAVAIVEHKYPGNSMSST